MKRILVRASAGAAVLALAAGAGAATYAGLSDPSSPTAATAQASAVATQAVSDGTLTIGEVYERSNDSVVEITVQTQATEGPLGPGSGTAEAQGSGFVYDASGHVVTNAHVVDGARSVEVTFANGKTYDATVVGTDASTDLAVLDVDAPASVLEPLALGDSSQLEVGDTVVAIGSPFGLESSVTAGIVSALDRSMEAPNGFTINGSIQTDAAINHGNSGGPLLDLNGRVIGINAQIASESGGNDGVGFAIPSSTVKTIVSQLLEDGAVEHAYLGVSVTRPDADTTGVQVAEVRSGSPAEEAGLAVGDVITAVHGDEIATTEELQAAIDAMQPGDTVELELLRDGASRTLTVTLGTRPA